jgi:hypothetical protein
MDSPFAEERHPDKGRELARLAAAANCVHRYIQLVRNWRALNSNATRASPLSLRAAHRSLRDALLGEIPGAPRVRKPSASARADGLLTDRLATTGEGKAGQSVMASSTSPHGV